MPFHEDPHTEAALVAARVEIERLEMEIERFRIPGDALELAVYKLDAAQARIQELEQEVERLNNQVDDLCIEAATLQADRDNWRAKAEG